MATDVNVTGLPAMTPPSAVTATSVNSGNSITSDQNAVVAAGAGLRYYGFSAMEDAGSTASFRIKHGTTGAGGTVVDVVTLMPGESTSDWYGPEGIDVAANGLSVDWLTGSFKLVLKHKTV